MALLELSVITGTLAQMGLEKGFAALGHSEAVIRARRRLKLPATPADRLDSKTAPQRFDWFPLSVFFRSPIPDPRMALYWSPWPGNS